MPNNAELKRNANISAKKGEKRGWRLSKDLMYDGVT
jgi:hypothetical protein